MTVTPTQRQVASWARKAREATARRNDWIRQAHAEGLDLRTIAAAAGLSHTAIHKIVHRTASL